MSTEKKKIEAGTHKVKIINWGLRETANENLQMYIGFSNGATLFQMVGISDEGNSYAAKSLAFAGFNGDDLPDLFKDDAFDKNREIEIFIKYKPNSETGKEEMNVYVNDPGMKMKGDLDRKEALGKLKGLKISLKVDIKAAKSEVVLPEIEKEKTAEKVAEAEETEEEIPF